MWSVGEIPLSGPVLCSVKRYLGVSSCARPRSQQFMEWILLWIVIGAAPNDALAKTAGLTCRKPTEERRTCQRKVSIGMLYRIQNSASMRSVMRSRTIRL